MEAINALAHAYWETPPVTRIYTASSVATTLAVQLEVISPFQLYFNPTLIFKSHQYWRLLTPFLYFGSLGFNFLFNLVFTYRYCRMLEEDFYRNRAADFFYMLLIGGSMMCTLAYFVNLLFLTQAFTIMIIYVWSRRNPSVLMNFFGMVTFRAPYLPWVLLTFSILISNSTALDIIGIVVGHFYYFFEDVFPNGPHGFRVLETPGPIKYIFEKLGIDEPITEEDERPEQFDFDSQDNTDELEDNNGEHDVGSDDDLPAGQPQHPNASGLTGEVAHENNSDNQLRARNVNHGA